MHKLIIKAKSAKLACGPHVYVYYPYSCTGDISYPGLKISMCCDDKRITCESCLKKMNKS